MKIGLLSLLFLFSFPLFSKCLTPEICDVINSVEMVLLSDSFSREELEAYREKVQQFVQQQEGYYQELKIKNSDLDQLKALDPLLASKVALSDCGESADVMAGAVASDLCYPCLEANKNDTLSQLAQDMNAVEQNIIANMAEEKLGRSALEQMLSLCDQGESDDVHSCVDERFGGKMPESLQEIFEELVAARTVNEPNRNAVVATKVNGLIEELRGGDFCPDAINVIAAPDGGIEISSWTLESNKLVDLELALQNCSPLNAMSLIENLFLGTNHQRWNFAEQEVFEEGFRKMWRNQHARAFGMLNKTMEEVGAVALGGRIYDCFMGFPPSEVSTHGTSVANFFNGGDLFKAKGSCRDFDAADVEKARQDALKIAAKELNQKDSARRGTPVLGLFGKRGSDELFLSTMARDNPEVLGEILAENLENGDSCVGHICEALKEAAKMERIEKRRAKIRRGVLIGVTVAAGVTFAFTPAAPLLESALGATLAGQIIAGTGLALGIASAVSAGADLAQKADELRAMKFRLMGEQGERTPQEWERLKRLEKEFDLLAVELAVEIGFSLFDAAQLIRMLGIRNMDDAVDLFRGLKRKGRGFKDKLLAACRR